MEIWKNIKGYDGEYKISNYGRVKSYKTINRPFIVVKDKWKSYSFVHLYKNSKYKIFRIHRLVAMYFIPNPQHKKCVNHIDNCRTNNHYLNLEWCTHQENIRWANKQNRMTFKRGENHPNKKLIWNDIKIIRNKYKSGVDQSEIGKYFKLSPSYISLIVNKKIWKRKN